MAEGESTTTQVLRRRKESRGLAQQEKMYRRPKDHAFRDGPWAIIGSDLRDYDSTFRTVLTEPLELLTKEIATKPMGAWALDIFADETVVEELVKNQGFTGGLAVSLGYPADKKTPKNVGMINGDILSKKTWEGASTWMKEKGIDAFDLILSRGEGALYKMPDSPDLQYYLLGQLWERLNPEGGTMLLQLPASAEAAFERWKGGAEKSGISVVKGPPDRDDGYFPTKIVRSPQSPAQLPKIGASVM